ncbi:hypothetical protein V8C37DRAFT_379194 [Trichoderma ceciliae]
MKFLQTSLVAACVPAALVSGRFVEENEVDHVMLKEPAKYLIELNPGTQKWVTEEDKWELRRGGLNFMDITDTQELGSLRLQARGPVEFPNKCVKQKEVNKLAGHLSKDEMQKNLEKLTSFHTRFFNSEYGRQSSEWVLEKINQIIKDAGADHAVTASAFPHSWPQNSVIARIPGKTNTTVIIGAHQDSINLWLPSILGAPGADDDGSGTVTIMDVFRTLLGAKDVVDGSAQNTVEFHWYSAEEGGLLGSQAIFHSYEKEGRDVKAMLQQDMTGFVQGTTDAGQPESVGVITDFVHPGLTAFIKKVIEEYCSIPWVETKCGYACSDHASASKAGYPSAFVIESSFENSDQHIHGTDDLIKYLSFDHMLEHAKMTLGLVYELAYHDFSSSASEEPSEL